MDDQSTEQMSSDKQKLVFISQDRLAALTAILEAINAQDDLMSELGIVKQHNSDPFVTVIPWNFNRLFLARHFKQNSNARRPGGIEKIWYYGRFAPFEHHRIQFWRDPASGSQSLHIMRKC